jgi:RHS repeat-associated protein
MQIIETITVKKSDFDKMLAKRSDGMHTSAMLRTLAGLVCGLTAVFAMAQADMSRTGLTVTTPNGYANITVDDMRVVGTAGPARWSRTWNGKEWKFNAHWESLSQSWTNLTGSMTGTSAGGGNTAPPPSDAESGCWVMVDEDWKPGSGTVIIDDKPLGAPMLPERTTPFNRLMGEEQNEYPPPRIVTVDYASLCKGIPLSSSPVRDVEAVRLKNELYLGDNGRYAFSNRTVLEKRAVRALAPASAAALASQLGTGNITLAPVAVAKGFRWMDKGGDWIDYNTQGQVVAYGDKNDNTVWMARDTGGTLRGVVDANGRVMFTLHYTGALVTEVRDYPIAGMSLDLPARSVKYQYDAANRMTAVIDVRGNTTRYGYDTANHIVTITDQEGRVETLAYAGSSVAKRTAPDGGVTDYLFEYDDVNKQFTSRITGPETAAGRRVEEFTHNRSGQLVRRAVNGRIDDEVRYDTGARAETHTNARGFSSRTTRNEFDQVIELVREDGSTIKQTYSALHLKPTETVDEMGVKTQYQYDTKGNLTKMVEAAGTLDERVTEYEVDILGKTTKTTRKGRTEANGTVTPDAVSRFEYDAQGQIKVVTDPEGNGHTFVHNRTGNIVSSTNPRGSTSRYEFDASDLLIKEIDALSHVQTYAYDKAGNLVSGTDANNRASHYEYDTTNRLLRSINALNGTSSLQYNAQGMPTMIVDEDGRKVEFEYDNFMRRIKQLDGMGNVTLYSYQIADGSNTGVLGSLNAPTETTFPTYIERMRYDQLERPASSTLIEPGQSERNNNVAYDARGLAKNVTNAYGKSYLHTYDALGQSRVTTDTLGKKTQAQYDVRGNLLQVTDANGNVYRYEYDRNNRVTKELLPLGQAIGASYDTAGNLTVRTDPNGNRMHFIYDAANRMEQVTQFNAAGTLQRTVKYTWGATNKLSAWSDVDNAGGRETSAVIAYDQAGRKRGEAITYPGGFTMSYTYTYSLAGKKTALQWPDGTRIGYGYSSHGELDNVTIPGEGTISINQFKWTAPSSITLPGGTVQEKDYDGLLNLTGLKVKAPNQQSQLSLANTYGKALEVTASTRADTGTAKMSGYTYDDAMRLTRVASETGGLFSTDTETFTLDAVGNRIAHSSVNGAWTYDANNRLKQRGTGNGATTYDYDAAGNLVRKAEPGNKVTQFTYNSENRLVEVKDGANSLIASYGYDPLGRRVWKEQYRDKDGIVLSQAARTYYLYANEGLVAEATQAITLNADQSVSANGQPVITAQYGPRPNSTFMTGALFIKTKNSNGQDTIAYYHHDHLGTPLQANDRLGNIVWAASYNAFGAAQILTPNPTQDKPTIISNLRLPGQIEDAETGLHYNYFRDYDPQTGRYVQSDPIGLAGGINTYRYAGGNPISQIDPSGLSCVAAGGRVTCNYPGGPTISFPRPSGWPDRIDSSSRWYHNYDKWVDAGCLTAGDLMPGITNNPTPGDPNPATPAGTNNDATPPLIGALFSSLDSMGGGGGGPPINPVISYLATDSSGGQYVINVTQPGHNLFPGYVMRTVTGSTIHNYGEGDGGLQSKYSPQWVQDAINNGWYGLSKSIIDKAKNKCGCK